jgi:uroporphyrin-III C-methyltransferase/precorrin-2 dehydrogenase/sirohydrochlorin ferrochelatase
MQLLPTSLNSTSGTVAVVGGGTDAAQAVRLLRSAGANVRWYSSDIDVAEEALFASPPPGWLELSFADPLRGQFADVTAVVCADDGPLDDAVAARARAANLPVHVVDRPEISTLALFTPTGRPTPWITGPIGSCWKASRSTMRRGVENGAAP